MLRPDIGLIGYCLWSIRAMVPAMLLLVTNAKEVMFAFDAVNMVWPPYSSVDGPQSHDCLRLASAATSFTCLGMLGILKLAWLVPTNSERVEPIFVSGDSPRSHMRKKSVFLIVDFVHVMGFFFKHTDQSIWPHISFAERFAWLLIWYADGGNCEKS